MGHELIFIMQRGGGDIRGTFNVWSWEKNGYKSPKFGVGMSVW
jgi:hypothetical protein